MRAVWRTRTLRAHNYALLRFRYDVAKRKLRRIQFGLIETHGSGILAPLSQNALWSWDHAQSCSNRIPKCDRSFKSRRGYSSWHAEWRIAPGDNDSSVYVAMCSMCLNVLAYGMYCMVL